MRTPRMALLVAAVAAPIVVSAASAAAPSASGGGFVRDGHGRGSTKTSLTLQAFDSANGDSGAATYSVHSPGTRGTHTRIELTCVQVAGNTAYARGADSTGKVWYLQVTDRGERARTDQFGVAQAGSPIANLALPLSNCGVGSVQQVAMRTVSGGNFQVR